MSNETQSLAMSRIEALIEENSFVEIGKDITARSTDFNLTEKKAPSDGVITGYGVIKDKPVYIYSQDAKVLKGTIGEMHSKKITKLYDLAMKTGAPIIGLIDCAGLRLEEALDALNGFGEIYSKQVEASGVIPQITGIFGTCGGGMSVFPALTDFTFIEKEKGKLFVNSPNAISNNHVSRLDTSSVKFAMEETGLIDFAGSKEEILEGIRELISLLPANYKDECFNEYEDDLNRGCPLAETSSKDVKELLKEVSDCNIFFEIKKDYGKDTCVGFISLNGQTVGAVGNRTEIRDDNNQLVEEFDGTISGRGARKIADFVRFCDAFNLPILSFTQVKGYKATLCNEKTLATALGDMIKEFSRAVVPKVNVVIGDSFGNAFTAMNSKSIKGADLVYAWENVKIGLMESDMAAKILCPEGTKKELKEKAIEYDKLQNSTISAARRGYVDTIIAPIDTRKYIIGAFELLYSKDEKNPDKKHETI